MSAEKHARNVPRLTSIQVLRGLAASMVVFHHWALTEGVCDARKSRILSTGIGYLGAAGVDIFFAISGFIMVYATQRDSGARDAIDFLGKRVRRIYPLYWIWTTLLLILWAVKLALTNHHYSTWFLIGSYLLYPVYDGTRWEPLMGAGWTLSFEMLFYLAFSVTIAARLRSLRLPSLVLVFAGLAAAGSFLPQHSGLRHIVSDQILVEFLFGVLAAEIVMWLRRIVIPDWVRRHLPYLLIGTGFAILISTLAPEFNARRWLDYGVPSLLIVLGAGLQPDLPAPRVLAFLGNASYTIYLTHAFATLAWGFALKHGAMRQGARFADSLSPDLIIVVGTGVTIAFTSLLHPLIEQPLLRWLPEGGRSRSTMTSTKGPAEVSGSVAP